MRRERINHCNCSKERKTRAVWRKHNRKINGLIKEIIIKRKVKRYLNLTWKIDCLESDVEMLEETFGNHITVHKPGTKYEEIQIRAYAHSIIVMKEIICLLKGGFPDGALVRARRLYEQTVIIKFLERRKSDSDFDELLERYCDAQSIEAYSNQIKCYDYYQNMAEKKKAEEKLLEMKKKYSSYFNGREYVRDYWWIGDDNYNSFNKLQRTFAAPFARIMYSRACISSHAGAIGDYALLGRLNPDGDKIYTDSTYNGFSFPLMLAVISFYKTTKMVFSNLKIKLPEAHKELRDLLEFYKKDFFMEREVDYDIDF